MTKKIIKILSFTLIFIFAAGIRLSADDSIEKCRRGLLKKMRAKTDIKQRGRKYCSENFEVVTDKKSIEKFGVKNTKKFEASMLRICYILEEAHKITTKITGISTSGKYVINISSPGVFKKRWGESGDNLVYYNGSCFWMAIPIEVMQNPLDDSSDMIARLYNTYALMFIYGKQGCKFNAADISRFREYIEELGSKLSKWNHSLSPEERKEIVSEVDKEYTFLFKKYPDLFKKKSVNKKTMECKWCKKEIDITGIRRGSRIKCPHCGKSVNIK